MGHIYDYPGLLLMTSLLYAIASERQRLYLALFALIVLQQRDGLCQRGLRGLLCRPHAVAELARSGGHRAVRGNFVGIYGGLAFAANGRSGVEFWLPQQIDWLLHLDLRFYVRLCGLVVFLTYAWREKPVFMRRAVWVLVPHLSLYACGAYPGEWRNFFESLPLISLFFCRNAALLVDLLSGLAGQLALTCCPRTCPARLGIQPAAARVDSPAAVRLRIHSAEPPADATPDSATAAAECKRAA